MVKAVIDLHSAGEDQRIDLIGRQALTQTVGVVLEKDEPDKVERYIRKVTTRFPTVVVLKRIDGPTKSAVTIKFGPRHS